MRRVTAQAVRRVEGTDDFCALGFDLLDRCRQFFGLEQRGLRQCGGDGDGQGQQVAEAGHGVFLVAEWGVVDESGVSKFSRARARLASDNSPRWLPSRRPSAL
ncbi:hypothetical protein D3C72_2136320 [compost metagenome]